MNGSNVDWLDLLPSRQPSIPPGQDVQFLQDLLDEEARLRLMPMNERAAPTISNSDAPLIDLGESSIRSVPALRTSQNELRSQEYFSLLARALGENAFVAQYRRAAECHQVSLPSDQRNLVIKKQSSPDVRGPVSVPDMDTLFTIDLRGLSQSKWTALRSVLQHAADDREHNEL